jgi:DNA-binding transcriptional regulator LsrR (DeoR family)
MLTNDYDSARLISRVLTLYYIEGKNQSDVAEVLGLSTAKVNRLLKQAREQGWVEITIRTPFQNIFDLEYRLQTVCHVPEAVVVPQLSQDPDAILQTVGRAAADYLLQRVRDGDTICISGGKAMYALVQALEPRRQYHNVRVVPATGGVQGKHYTHVNYLAAELATRLGGKAYQLHAPVFVDTRQERDALLSLRQISEVLAIAREAQIALVGVGSVIPKSSSYFDLTSLGNEQAPIIAAEQGQGEIFALIYNAQGQPCAEQYNQRVVGLSLEELRTIPLSIGIAAAEQKVLPIRGALQGKYLKTIITDESTALGVLDLYERDARR